MLNKAYKKEANSFANTKDIKLNKYTESGINSFSLETKMRSTVRIMSQESAYKNNGFMPNTRNGVQIFEN